MNGKVAHWLIIVLLFAFLMTGANRCLMGQNFQTTSKEDELSFYIYPRQLFETACVQQLIQTPEWTEFYLSYIKAFDEQNLTREEWRPFARQLEKSFTRTPPSLDSVFETLVAYGDGLWLQMTLDPGNMRLQPGEPFAILVSEYSPLETKRLIQALMERYGMISTASQMDSVLAFRQGELLVWFFDQITSIPVNEGKTGFILGRNVGEMNRARERFLRDVATLDRIRTPDELCGGLNIGHNAIEKVGNWFKSLPKEDLLAPFSPGINELSKKIDRISCKILVNKGIIVIETVVFCTTAEMAADMESLLKRSCDLFQKWSEQEQTSSKWKHCISLLNRSTSEIRNRQFIIRTTIGDEQSLQNLKALMGKP